MALRLDHCFILTHPGAAEAELLAAIGLIEGSSNTHPGQGTANRRFFFANTTLEFLYLRDLDEADNGPGNKLRFPQRLGDDQASPFGLIFRRDEGDADLGFESWSYYPEYLADDLCFHVGANSDCPGEPLCICMPDGLQRPDNSAPVENPEWSLTELKISLPTTQPSATLQRVAASLEVSLILGRPHLLELYFQHASLQKTHDFRPHLPLVIHCQA